MQSIQNEELRWTGKLFGGIREDINRRIPNYGNDLKDGFHSKVAGTTLFLFFAALANAIAFGALSGLVTGNEIGIMEMLVVTAVGGILFALFGGQPLIILGGTGPIVIFTGLLYNVCQQNNISFVATYAWVGIWSGIFLLICAFTDASALMKYFTRFTDEIFAALISVIFIVEAVKDVVKSFSSDGHGLASAFFSLVLALGTFIIARNLKRIINSPYTTRLIREFLSDFGPAIAIIAMTFFAMQFSEISLARPAVPSSITTTSGRPWTVDLFAVPTWVIFGSILPAILATILLFLDQNITARLVNSPDNKLVRGSGYHLDLAIVGLIVLVGSFFALPWIVAATVHSLNHVRSLSQMKIIDVNGVKKEIIDTVRENRISGLLIHIFVGVSIFFLSYFQNIPMPVLFGLFLYMGITSLSGNQFYERILLWVTDRNLFPQTHYTKRVPVKDIHRFTIIQLLCFVILWVLKASKLGILFPLMIAALVPIRIFMARYFEPGHIDALESEEAHDEGEKHILD